MRILGIDPGIARAGWGIIEENNGKVRALDFGCIETTSEKDTSVRLLEIYKTFLSIINTCKPDILSVEELFFNTNAKTALTVGQARGVIFLAGAQNNLPLRAYTPLQVKTAITGYGRAEKSQIGNMVKIILKLKNVPKPDDTADALAIALTHAFQLKVNPEIRR